MRRYPERPCWSRWRSSPRPHRRGALEIERTTCVTGCSVANAHSAALAVASVIADTASHSADSGGGRSIARAVEDADDGVATGHDEQDAQRQLRGAQAIDWLHEGVLRSTARSSAERLRMDRMDHVSLPASCERLQRNACAAIALHPRPPAAMQVNAWHVEATGGHITQTAGDLAAKDHVADSDAESMLPGIWAQLSPARLGLMRRNRRPRIVGPRVRADVCRCPVDSSVRSNARSMECAGPERHSEAWMPS